MVKQELIRFVNFDALRLDYESDLSSAVSETFASGQLVGGSAVVNFEEEFARFCGTRFAVGVGNGLDALRISLLALGIKPGDEVIVPAFTFYASWLSILQLGATLVPVDVHVENGTIDSSQIHQAIGPRTKAIVVVHLYGNSVAMDQIMRISLEAGIPVVEDVAQAHGGKLGKDYLGGIGDVGAFSFYPTKNLGAFGDAGIITTNSPEVAEIATSVRSYGNGPTKFDFARIGLNSRLDPIQAAFLRKRLNKLPGMNSVRQRFAERYRTLIDSSWGAVVGPSQVSQSVWHLFCVRTSSREAFQKHLLSHGIQSDLHYPYWIGSIPLLQEHIRWPVSRRHFDGSKELAQTVVSVPLGPWLSESEAEKIGLALARKNC